MQRLPDYLLLHFEGNFDIDAVLIHFAIAFYGNALGLYISGTDVFDAFRGLFEGLAGSVFPTLVRVGEDFDDF